MQQLLSKFFIIKSLIYVIGFSILWYLLFTKPSIELLQTDSSYTTWVNQICFTNNCFDIEVVDTHETRKQWLMFRESLPSQSWMLFVFEKEAIYPFWMKNTLIPLDMIWIDKNWKIVDIKTAQPCTSDPCLTYTPSGSGLYVLEINAGVGRNLFNNQYDDRDYELIGRAGITVGYRF